MAGLLVDVLHTPGHTADSVCFVVTGGADGAGSRVVLTGDTVLGRGTTVVAHPDGALAPYLDSLRRIVDARAVTLLPGHGPVRPDAAALATEYLAHREAAPGAGARPRWPRARRRRRRSCGVVYADVDQALWPAAELSVRAQLDYLTAESEAGA